MEYYADLDFSSVNKDLMRCLYWLVRLYGVYVGRPSANEGQRYCNWHMQHSEEDAIKSGYLSIRSEGIGFDRDNDEKIEDSFLRMVNTFASFDTMDELKLFVDSACEDSNENDYSEQVKEHFEKRIAIIFENYDEIKKEIKRFADDVLTNGVEQINESC